ncbi:MAG: phenylalanine--tRNA ligase subunit alpha [Chthoniobacterales bacterium]|nr:phenylalanine--tRNA ligase subunit alpha [Chthoniobacterales bacterium]
MQTKIHQLQQEALAALEAASNAALLKEVRVRYLGKVGAISQLSEGMRQLSKEERPLVGKLLHELRTAFTQALEAKEKKIQEQKDTALFQGLDLTLPGTPLLRGALHPLTLLTDRVVQIFRRLGFAMAEGPDIDSPWYCFDALNTPPDHPARNEQDTFYLPDGRLLRTQTSTIQIRSMEQAPPPIRIIAPGAAYRRDETDATHLAQFNQLEILSVAEGISLADLKGTAEFFFRELFGPETECRFRPHFFPFTEPSYEIDIRVPSLNNKWIELAGCGMVDPAVFEAISQKRGDKVYDPDKISGFAFGFGLDRLAMMMTGIDDVRLLVENDLQFLERFVS